VHVHVAYPVPLNTIVGAEEKQPIYPPLVIVNDVTACAVRLAVIFIAFPPLKDIVGCDINVPSGLYNMGIAETKLPNVAVVVTLPPPNIDIMGADV